MHDDIMDKCILRRGKATVHEKYDNNTAILSGDAMLIHSYEMLTSYPAHLISPLLKVSTQWPYNCVKVKGWIWILKRGKT